MKGLRTMLKETSPEVPSLVEYHIWRGRWTRWKEPWKRWRIPWGANHVDDLVHKTDSPFIASITSHPLTCKFKMPTLDWYDGTCDLCDYIAMFKTTMHLQGVLDKILCRASPTTSKGPARVWSSKLPPNTITSF